jgi:hypothetical protein
MFNFPNFQNKGFGNWLVLDKAGHIWILNEVAGNSRNRREDFAIRVFEMHTNIHPLFYWSSSTAYHMRIQNKLPCKLLASYIHPKISVPIFFYVNNSV